MTLTEKYFRAIGWNYFNRTPDWPRGYWSESEFFKPKYKELPKITQSFPDFKLHVLEKMRGEGYWFTVNPSTVVWQPKLSDVFYLESHKDNEILSAGVVAATRYFETKGENK